MGVIISRESPELLAASSSAREACIKWPFINYDPGGRQIRGGGHYFLGYFHFFWGITVGGITFIRYLFLETNKSMFLG